MKKNHDRSLGAIIAVLSIDLLDRRIVCVLDEITDPKGEVRWGMVTEADVKLDGNKAILSQQGEKLTAEMVSPPGAKFEIVSTKPPTPGENQNRAPECSPPGSNPQRAI
jgi:hypothetical protein